jgi:hypothetical protein
MPDPQSERFQQALSEAVNAMQRMVLITSRLVGPGRDLVDLHDAAVAAATALLQLRPDPPSASEGGR